MRITTLLLLCFVINGCKEKVQLDDFPLEVQNPLLDGDPLIISWNLSGADSLKLDNDLFLKSDTAYYYLVGTDAIRIRVYKNKEVVYERYIRYQLQDGERLADISVPENNHLISVPANFLGISFPFDESVAMIGSERKENTILINLLKNLYRKSKSIPVTIKKPRTSADIEAGITSLNLLAGRMKTAGYHLLYSIELPDKAEKDFLTQLQQKLDPSFIHSIIGNWKKLPSDIRMIAEKMGKEMIHSGERDTYHRNEKGIKEVDLGKFFNCNTNMDSVVYLSQDFFARSMALTDATEKQIINLTIPSCEQISNSFETSLWLIDYLLLNLEQGVLQVNINIGNGNNNSRNYASPFVFDVPAANLSARIVEKQQDIPEEYLLRSVQSPYYAMWMVSDLIQDGNKIQSLKVDSANNIKAYRITTASDKHKFILINKEPVKSGRVFIKDTSIHRAWGTRLIAPSYSSISGLRYGGRYFDGSTDGNYRGAYYTDKVDGKILGNRIGMPAASAVLVQSKH